VIASEKNRLVEIQVRSSLQHLWAELSEKFSDVIDPAIKYGGGGLARPEILDETSELVADHELLGLKLASLADPRSKSLNAMFLKQRLALSELLRKQIEKV
jgi:ppGpp synthetase/RelA/SpoT-type nucleotidyltranferase